MHKEHVRDWDDIPKGYCNRMDDAVHKEGVVIFIKVLYYNVERPGDISNQEQDELFDYRLLLSLKITFIDLVQLSDEIDDDNNVQDGYDSVPARVKDLVVEDLISIVVKNDSDVKFKSSRYHHRCAYPSVEEALSPFGYVAVYLLSQYL